MREIVITERDRVTWSCEKMPLELPFGAGVIDGHAVQLEVFGRKYQEVQKSHGAGPWEFMDIETGEIVLVRQDFK